MHSRVVLSLGVASGLAFTFLSNSTAQPGPAAAATQATDSSFATLVLPSKDPELQAALRQVLRDPPFNDLVSRRRLSVSLIDLSTPGVIRYAGVDDDHMRYAASLPKIAIMLAVFDQIDSGKLTYTPQLRRKMERMIRKSSNREASELIKLVGFEAIAKTLQDPRYQLYGESRNGGLWVGKDYGGDLGRWKRDPMHAISHGATARQAARFFVMLDRQMLVSSWASTEMKDILSRPEVKHKFVLGLSSKPRTRIFRKSGTWREWHSDAALIERDGKKYVAVALMESAKKGVLARLIVRLDDLVTATPPVATSSPDSASTDGVQPEQPTAEK